MFYWRIGYKDQETPKSLEHLLTFSAALYLQPQSISTKAVDHNHPTCEPA